MLRFLARQKRSSKILLLIFVLILTAGLIGFFTISGGKGLFSTAPNNDTTVAKVEGYKITVKELKDALSAFSQQTAGGGPNMGTDPGSMYAMYGKEVMDGLIRQKLVQYEADRLNLGATDSEVQSRLRQYFNPWPGYDAYKRQVQQSGLSLEQFEENLRASISEEKLKSFITAAVQVSPKEVEDDYRRTNTSYNVRWVEVHADAMKDKVQVNDADLQAYFDQHKSDFHINAEERKARYIFIDQTKAGEAVKLSDDELRKDFDPDRAVQQVRVSEIVLKVPGAPPAPPIDPAAVKQPGDVTKIPPNPNDELTRKKADDIVAAAKGEGRPQAEDFAKLAREKSEDPKTKASGGDLGYIDKKAKRDSDDPLNRVFTMKKDEVSPPIKKGENYYILKVTDKKVPTFEDSRDELLKEERAKKSYSQAVDIATEAEQQFKSSKNAQAVADEINKKYGAEVASVRETPFVAPGQEVPNLGGSSEFSQGLFELQDANDVGDRQNVTNGFAIPQYVEKRDPHDQSFDEAKTKVEEQYRANKSKELALAKASEMAKAKTPDQLKALATAAGLTPQDKAGISGGDAIGPLLTDAGKDAVYKLKVDEVTPEPVKIENSDDYVVVALTGKKDADMGDPFQKDRKTINDRLLGNKRDELYNTFLAATEKRMKDEGKIKIYSDVIDTAMAGSTEQTPRAPGVPAGRPRPRRQPGARR